MDPQNPTSSPDELLTVQEIAQELKVNVETVRRWIRSGTLPAFVLGNSDRRGYRVRRADLDSFLVRAPGANDDTP